MGGDRTAGAGEGVVDDSAAAGENPDGLKPAFVIAKFAKRPRAFANLENDVTHWYPGVCVVDEREFARPCARAGGQAAIKDIDLLLKVARFVADKERRRFERAVRGAATFEEMQSGGSALLGYDESLTLHSRRS
jgi:hypothetical protein